MPFSLLRCLSAPRGGAGGTRGTAKYSAGEIRARPTEDVADVVDNDFGYACLLMLPIEAAEVVAFYMPPAPTRGRQTVAPYSSVVRTVGRSGGGGRASALRTHSVHRCGSFSLVIPKGKWISMVSIPGLKLQRHIGMPL